MKIEYKKNDNSLNYHPINKVKTKWSNERVTRSHYNNNDFPSIPFQLDNKQNTSSNAFKYLDLIYVIHSVLFICLTVYGIYGIVYG